MAVRATARALPTGNPFPLSALPFPPYPYPARMERFMNCHYGGSAGFPQPIQRT